MDSALENTFSTDKSHGGPSGLEDEVAPKKPRTSEDFYLFCKFVLDHENYENDAAEESLRCNEEITDDLEEDVKIKEEVEYESSTSNLKEEINDIQNNSVKASSKKRSKQPKSDGFHGDVDSDDEDSYDLVTCFCDKPFAGRAMIECSVCLTWIHLSCAKVRRSHIPEVYICPNCKDKKSSS